MKKTVLSLFAAAIALSACSGSGAEYDATGTFEATEVTVSAQETGQLLTFCATEGTELRAGQQVGIIDTTQLALTAMRLGATHESIASQRPDIDAQMAALRQQIDKAETERQRYEKLVADNAANRKQLDDAESAVRVLRRQLEALQSTLGNSTRSLNRQMTATEIQRWQAMDRLAKCHITSPIDGTVLETYAEQGEFAATGKPLFKIADTKRLFLRAYITSAQLADVRVGQHATVVSDYGDGKGQSYDGTVTWISPKSEFTPKTILTEDERADLVYAVKIRISNDGYAKIGMYGRVRFQK